MTPYIANLTDDLIHTHQFDLIADEIASKDAFLEHIRLSLARSIKKFTGETLGRVIFSIDMEEPGYRLDFSFKGLCAKALRALAVECLALTICERIKPAPGSKVLPFKARRKSKART
jgi:hypothetical protein